jgi:hypothetical protein
MVCREVENLLPDYSAEALPRQQLARVGEHLRGCEHCRREWERLQGALRLVVELATVSPPPGLWHGVSHRIQAGDELAMGRPGDRATGRRLPIWRWWSWPVRTATAAGAAAVLAVVWFSYGTWAPIGVGGLHTLPSPRLAALTDPEMVAAVQQHTLASTGQLFADRAGLESVVQLMRQRRVERAR